MPRWSLLLALAGCGRLDFAPIGTSSVGGDGGSGLPGPDAHPPGGDSAVTADALMVPMCGSTVIFADDFTSGTPGAGWGQVVTTGNYTVSTQNGNAHIAAPPNAPVGSKGAVRQTQSEAFPGVCAIVELAKAPADPKALAYLRVGTDTKYMQIYVQGNQLWGSFLSGGTGGTLGPNGYDAVNERFLRIRVVGSTYFFEAGPSLTSFPVTIGSEGGSVVDPSPSSIELGVSVSAAGVAATSADFGMAILLGP